MSDADLPQFIELLDSVCSLLSRGAYVPNPRNTLLFFRCLQRYDIAMVRAALDAHVCDPQRGKFVPTPADVIAQIQAQETSDGRPGAEEAWALAQPCADERATVVWTAEMAQAWGIAKALMDAGDQVGARMAFRQAYERLVDEARSLRQPVRWTASLGTDERSRKDALAKAEAAGLLTRTLEPTLGYDGPPNPDGVARVRGALGRLAEAAAKREAFVDGEPPPSEDFLAKEATRKAQAALAARVAKLQGGLSRQDFDQ